MSQVDKVIEIKCESAAYLDLDEMTWFQGKLKSITEDKFKDLKESLKKDGLVSPFNVWKDSKEFLSDGHHRWLALSELRKEGYSVPKIPVGYIKAKNKAEAAKNILIQNSRYARTNEESLSDFMIEFELSVTDLEFLDIQDVSNDYYSPESDAGFDPSVTTDAEKEQKTCPHCGEAL